MSLCECDSPSLVAPCPSEARWVAPDGKVYCSMHFIQAFGHSEPLVKVEDYEPPKKPQKSKSKAAKASG